MVVRIALSRDLQSLVTGEANVFNIRIKKGALWTDNIMSFILYLLQYAFGYVG
jgi:hypothetical protein